MAHEVLHDAATRLEEAQHAVFAAEEERTPFAGGRDDARLVAVHRVSAELDGSGSRSRPTG
jgi:hypothetical protein